MEHNDTDMLFRGGNTVHWQATAEQFFFSKFNMHHMFRYPRHSLEESQRRLARTCISRTPCLSFRELSSEHHLLGADDCSFRRWCSDGQTTRNVYLSDQTLSFSSPPKIRSDSWVSRKKKTSAAICHSEKTAENAWSKTKHSPAKRRPTGTGQRLAIGEGQRQQGLSFSLRKHDVTYTRRPRLSSMFIPCSHGQLQGYSTCRCMSLILIMTVF